METLIIIVLSITAAVAVGGFVVLWADRRGNRDEDQSTSNERAGRSVSQKSPDPFTKPLVTNFQITPSLNRHCLLAFNRSDANEKSGTCSCMRDDVSLWSVFLRSPLFMAVDDNGCAIFFDAEDDGVAVRVKVLDVAGIERFNEVFLMGFLEYGEAFGGSFVWGITEGRGAAEDKFGGELLVWELAQGGAVARCMDPRASDDGLSGPVVSLVVDTGAVVIQFEQGKSVRVPLNANDGFRRPDTVAQILSGGAEQQERYEPRNLNKE